MGLKLKVIFFQFLHWSGVVNTKFAELYKGPLRTNMEAISVGWSKVKIYAVGKLLAQYIEIHTYVP